MLCLSGAVKLTHPLLELQLGAISYLFACKLIKSLLCLARSLSRFIQDLDKTLKIGSATPNRSVRLCWREEPFPSLPFLIPATPAVPMGDFCKARARSVCVAEGTS